MIKLFLFIIIPPSRGIIRDELSILPFSVNPFAHHTFLLKNEKFKRREKTRNELNKDELLILPVLKLGVMVFKILY